MKIEDRMIDKIAIMIALSIKGRAKETAKSILALISSIECGDCTNGTVYDFGMERDRDCLVCKGTGYRKVMVKRPCSNPYCVNGEVDGDDDSLGNCSDDSCKVCKGVGDLITPFSPADLLDIINGSATLVLEVEG